MICQASSCSIYFQRPGFTSPSPLSKLQFSQEQSNIDKVSDLYRIFKLRCCLSEILHTLCTFKCFIVTFAMATKEGCFLKAESQTPNFIRGLLKALVCLTPFSCHLQFFFTIVFLLCCPKMLDFGRRVPQKLTNLNLDQINQTMASLFTIWHIMHLPALICFRDIAHFVHLWGH